ncbi:hypothetical protein JHN46_08905 [Streptomyces sp. MBT33]|nr:hypothetical protein [Streptomyces sp. MBT33]
MATSRHDGSPDKKSPTGGSTGTGGSPSPSLGLPTKLPSELPSKLPSRLPSGIPSGIESLIPSLGGLDLP